MEASTEGEKTKSKRGRKPLMEGEDSIEIGFRCPRPLDEELQRACATLTELTGKDVNKSDLIRAIIGYRISNAVYIYREVNSEK